MNQHLIDQAQAVRPEDELNLQAVSDFARQHMPTLQGALHIQQFKGGASNLTYQLNFDNASLILRTSPKGTKAKGAHNMAREFDVMQKLKPVYPYVPSMIAFCADETRIGREFYLMEKIEGIIPRASLPKELNLTPPQVTQLCTQVIDKLIQLHQVDIEQTGLNQLGKGTGYCQRQILGWTERYQKAKTWNVPAFTYVTDWLKANQPMQEQSCLIHNDYRFDNVVLSPQNPLQVIGVLDWEMATIGDPLMDLGNTLAYWVQANDDFIAKLTRRQPTHLPGMFTRAQVVEYYCHHMKLDPQNFRFYEIYGLFRLAVIMQQIYYRYHHGQTTNPAFKNFWLLVHYMHYRCRKLIP